VRSVATGLFTLVFTLGGAIGSAAVAGLTEPLGLAGALAGVAVLPAAGALLALVAGSLREGRSR
jgi:cyanate permease